jgi:hypothetical protein
LFKVDAALPAEAVELARFESAKGTRPVACLLLLRLRRPGRLGDVCDNRHWFCHCFFHSSLTISSMAGTLYFLPLLHASLTVF